MCLMARRDIEIERETYSVCKFLAVTQYLSYQSGWKSKERNYGCLFSKDTWIWKLQRISRDNRVWVLINVTTIQASICPCVIWAKSELRKGAWFYHVQGSFTRSKREEERCLFFQSTAPNSVLRKPDKIKVLQVPWAQGRAQSSQDWLGIYFESIKGSDENVWCSCSCWCMRVSTIK